MARDKKKQKKQGSNPNSVNNSPPSDSDLGNNQPQTDQDILMDTSGAEDQLFEYFGPKQIVR